MLLWGGLHKNRTVQLGSLATISAFSLEPSKTTEKLIDVAVSRTFQIQTNEYSRQSGTQVRETQRQCVYAQLLYFIRHKFIYLWMINEEFR
jgi:hypothetical protein